MNPFIPHGRKFYIEENMPLINIYLLLVHLHIKKLGGSIFLCCFKAVRVRALFM